MTGSLEGDEGLRLALVNHSGAENRTRLIGLIESPMCVGVPGVRIERCAYVLVVGEG